jgi:hypothetical protein
MFKDDKKRDEVLAQLATKLTVSAHQLSEAARRLQLAELTYREYLDRLRKLDQHMKQLIGMLQGPAENAAAPETNPAFCEPPTPPTKPANKKKLRYADYIEFSNYAELKKFEKMSKISDEEIAKCDSDELMKKLMNGG